MHCEIKHDELVPKTQAIAVRVNATKFLTSVKIKILRGPNF